MKNKYNEVMFEQEASGILFPTVGFIAAVLTVIMVAAYFAVAGHWFTVGAQMELEPEKVYVSDNAAAEELNKLQAKLKDQASKLAAITSIRSDIALQLKQKLEPLNLNAVIDTTTGNVRFNDGLLFDSNSSTLSAKGQDYLNRFFPVYVQVLLEGKYKDYLDGIIIEGHADDGGTYVFNIELSEKRSLSTIRYIIDKKLVPVEITDKYVSFSGRAFAVPVMVNGNVDRNLSRRVEFGFKLKEDKLSQEMLEALK